MAEGKVHLQMVFRRCHKAHHAGRAARRAVALLGQDAVQNGKAGLHAAQQVDEHLAEALLIREAHVPLGLLQAGNAAEQILGGSRKAGHHVGLELGQVDEHIAVQHRLNQGKGPDQFSAGCGFPASAVGVEGRALLPAHIGQAAHLIDAAQDGRVVDPAGGIRHHDGGSAPAAHRPNHRPHQGRVGGHRLFRRVLGQQIGLQQHLLARQRFGGGQLAEQPLHRGIHRLLVIACRRDKIYVVIHSRPRPAAAAERPRSGPAPASDGSRNRRS